jgi:CRISPR-associated endoribonuclease Cas6
MPEQSPASRSRFILPDILSEVTFDLIPLRLHFIAPREIHFPIGTAANLLRGILGASFMKTAPDAYARRFTPGFAGGPSGLRDAPRAFTFRAWHLDGVSVAAGEPFHFGVNLFETKAAAVDLFAAAFSARFGAPCKIDGAEMLQLPLEKAAHADRIRVRFVTPTELKGADQPEFGVLFARIRDRVSTLRALYGDGPLEIDFKAMGERAAQVKMTRCEIGNVDVERTSRATGQTHSLGGFTGVAEYEGKLGEFLPYLEIARYTGVGRQTVWGKGEIDYETF